MHWLRPDFLLAAAAVVLPIALHLLRRRVTRPIPFPALRFLAPNRPRDRRQNFHRRLVLALRCLVLGLLAAAFARPFLGQPAPAAARASVVVIDNSFSLQAADRWTQLAAWARRELSNPSPGDTIGLLLMNPQPTWLVPPTRDTAAALAALAACRPGWETTRAEPALRLAADTLAASPASTRRLIFLGDHQALGWAGADFGRRLPPGVTAVFSAPPFPAPTRQAALHSPALQLSGDAAVATVIVRNFGNAHPRTLRLFAGDGSELHTEPLELAAGEIRTFRRPLPAAALSKGWIRFVLDPDDLPADDTAWAVSPDASGARPLLLLDHAPASAEADYVATACQALAALPPTLRIAPLPAAATWPMPAVAILRHESSFTSDAAARLDAFLAAGGSTLLFLDGSPAQLRWLAAHGIVPAGRPEGDARLRDWAIDHPLVAPLAHTSLRSLVGWTFRRGWALPVDVVEPIASWADGSPAFGEVRLGAGRVLIAGFGPDRRDGDWPLAPAFVPFLHRSVAHLLDADPTVRSLSLVGQPLALPQGDVGSWRALDGPASSNESVPVAAAVVPRAPGVYEWSRGSERTLFAVNLPPDESDLTPWTEGTPWTQLVSTERAAAPAMIERIDLAAQDAEQQSPLWWWCFAAMAAFALAELAFANRTAR